MGTNERRRRASRRQFVGLLVLLALAIGAFLLYQEYYEDASKLRASFVLTNGAETPRLKLEIASTPAERQKGLMYRQPGSLDSDEGMIFVFPRMELHSFFMKNTYLSLDMVFIDRDFKVVGILHDVPILNEAPRSVSRESQYVIELLAGTAKRLGISEGATLKLHGPLPQGVS